MLEFFLFQLPWWGYVLVTLALTHITIVSVTIFLHRHQAHGALQLHPVLSHFFRFWLWLTTGIITKEWVAVHRKHHATVESDDDPHSPQKVGINRVLWGGLILYRRAARLPGILDQYGVGTPDDWLERHVYAKYPNTGLFLMLLINVFAFGLVAGVSIWAVQMVWIPFWAAGVINGVGHYLGYRNFNLPDASRNIVPWGIVIGGEELHNNHHAYSASAQFSARKWEIDLGWCYVRLLNKFKLVKIQRKIPKLTFNQNKQHCDFETVKVFVANRFQVMSKYANDVVKGVCREEIRSASGETRRLLKQAKRLLASDHSRLSDLKKEWLNKVLETNSRIATVYAMKESLQNIASRSSNSYEQVCQSLEEWCQRAEESDIDALMKFSARLKGATAN